MGTPYQHLRILTWNATGIMSSSSYLCQALYKKNIDICGIAEHWLYEKDLHFLNQIDSNYHCHAVSDFSLRFPGRRRVGKGGVAILWHKKHNANIVPLFFDDDRIIGVKFVLNHNCSFCFFQVYLPCSNHPISSYRDYIDRLRNIMSLYSEKGTVVLMGDMNVNMAPTSIHAHATGRLSYFRDFMQDNNSVSVNTLDICSGAKSSYVSYDGRYKSLLDHIIIPSDKLDLVESCEICEDDCLNVSRHRPVFCQLKLPQNQQQIVSPVCEQSINWKNANSDQIDTYQCSLHNNKVLLDLDQGEIGSNDDITRAYLTLVNEVNASAKLCFPLKRFKPFLKPYWNYELSSMHSDMKQKRAEWITQGKLRGNIHPTYKMYKLAKALFRRKHRFYVQVYMKKQIEEIDRLAEVNSDLFWRHVNSRRKKSNSFSGSELNFNGRIVSTPQEVADGWAKHFETLYGRHEGSFDDEFKCHITREMRNINESLADESSLTECPIITAVEVQAAARLAHRGKAAGEDGITYEHIIFGGDFLYKLLAKLFNAVLQFSFAPREMKKGVIISLFKGGRKKRDNPDSYRAITLTPVVTKLLERILLTRIELFDNIRPQIHHLQGGFQKNFGCLMTSFMLRELVFHAKENSSKLYVCFLDVKKAFDCVWHDGLFYKLYRSGINKRIFKVFQNLFTGMKSCVKCQNCKSGWFSVLRGTGQGRVISPPFYLVFINDLMYELENSKLGMCYYHIMLLPNCGGRYGFDFIFEGSLGKNAAYLF